MRRSVTTFGETIKRRLGLPAAALVGGWVGRPGS